MTDERHDSLRPEGTGDSRVEPEATAATPDATSAVDADATVTASGAPAAADHEQPGTMIGNYKLLGVLGEGGFGTVYLAEQLQPIKRRVALKIIKLGMDTREVIARFEAEKQALALMDHPGIAKVFDAGATGTGRPYFVMELVEGVPVTAYCDRNRLPTPERLELFREICAAVQHAHQKGVIHRDIKPSNVLVTEIEGRPVPKVIDFGIAKATEARLTEKTFFTLEANFIGTPAYMSPEQTGLSDLDVDTRSDIYSLGVLLYELLAGVTPFDEAALRSAGFAEIQRIIREDDPPRPSARVSRLGERLTDTAEHRRLRGAQLVKHLKGELDWIVMKCLEKDRARRYETANGLARDVERYLADEPVAASPPSRSYRLRKLVVRNRAVFTAGAAMVLLLAAGVMGTSIGLVRAKQAERAARSEAAKSDQVAGFLTDMLQGVGPATARGRDTEMLEEIVGQTDEKIGAELEGQPEVEGLIRSFLATTYYDLGRIEKSKAQFEQARDLLIEARGEVDEDVAKQYDSLGQVHEQLQEYDASEASYLKALELRRALFGDADNEDLAMNLVNLANLYVNLGRYEEAEPMLLEGLERLRRLHGEKNEFVAITLNSLGNLMQHLKRYDEAGPYYEQALAAHTALLGEDHPYVITDLTNLGWLAMNTGDMAGATERFRKAAVLARRVYTEPNFNLIMTLNSLATAEQRSGQPEVAEPVFRECVALADSVYGPDHASTADALLKLGSCLSDLGRFAEADSLSRGAIAIHEKVFGPDDRITLRSRYNYAYTVYNRGDYDKAIPLLTEMVTAYTAAVGREHDHTALVLSNLGRALRDAGRLDEAGGPLTECREIRMRVLGPDHLMVGVADQDLGEARYLEGRLAEADSLLTAAQTIYTATLDSTHLAFGSVELLRARVDLGLGHPQEALALVARGRPIMAKAKGEDHPQTLGYDTLEGLVLARGGDLDAAGARADEIEPKLAALSPRKQAPLQLDLGRIRTLDGDYGDAEQLLLASHETFSGTYGDRSYLAGQAQDALVAMYDAWAQAGPGVSGSVRAAAAAKKWRARR